MKMKKTQSLKLMLLGLMALVSGSAFAAVGDIFVSGDNAGGQLYYQQITAKGVKLIGVQTVGTGGNIIVPTKALNTWMNKANDLDVIEIADNWSLATEVAIQKVDANGNVLEKYPQGKSKALTDYEGLITLTIEAEQLKTISTEALQPLNGKIKKFVVAGPDATATPEKKGAGLTAIPDYAFFRATAIDPIENQAVRDAITALERQKALVDFKIDGKERLNAKLTDGSVVYYLTELDKHDAKDGVYTPVVKSLKADANGVYDLINAETGESTGIKAIDWPNSIDLADPESHKVVATPYYPEIKGLQDQYDAAKANAEHYLDLLTAMEAQTGEDSWAGKKAAYEEKKAAYEELTYVWEFLENNPQVKQDFEAIELATADAIRYCIQTPNPNMTGWTEGQSEIFTRLKIALNNSNWPKKIVNDKVVGYKVWKVGGLNTAITNAKAEMDAAKTAWDRVQYPAQDGGTHKWYEDAKKAEEDKMAAIEPYLNYWKGQRDGIAAQIKDKEDNELLIPQYEAATDLFGNVLNNEVLKVVHLYGPNLVGIGESAFQNCTEAVFGPKKGGPDSKIPLTTKTIGPRAFQNTIIDPVFDNLVDLESIGDFAFAQSGATTAVFTNATKLANFGTNVFDDCKLKNLLLLGTPLTAIPGNLAEGIYRDYVNFVDACGTEWNKPGDNEHKVLVNNTLKTVSLPAAITIIRDGNFANCIVLATLDGGIPAGVESIGAEAFFRTKIKEFDLSLLSKLTFIGEKAFAGNAQLTKVILPQNPADGYTLTELPSNVFECDDNLEDVILGPDVTCLPEGIFAGNTKMKKLDLSNTQIEILYNLFQAGDGTIKDDQGNVLNPVNNTLVEIILPEETRDLDGHIITPGLKIIMDYALANLQALKGAKQADGTYKMVIPSSVYIMRPGVFSNDISLEYVEAMDSRLTNLGVKTFESCTSLKEFKFITLLPINPAWVTVPAGGLANMECGNSEDGVIGGFEQRRWVLDPNQLMPLPQPGLPSPEPRKIYEWDYNDNGEKVANPDFSSLWNQASNDPTSEEGEDYGTEYVPVWGPGVKFDAATFNFDDMQFHGNHAAPVQVWVTEESMNNLQGYYRQTYDNNLVQYSKLNKYAFKLKLDKIKDGSYAKTYYSTDFGTWIATDEAGVFTAYQDYENVVLYKAKHNGGYFKIPAAHALSDGREFAPDGTNYYAPGNFISSADDVAKPHNSAAVVIVSDKEEITIKRVTKPNEIYQSTLDRDNELRIATATLEPSTHYPVHGFTFYHDLPVFYPYTSGKLYAGTVVLKASDYQGTGAPARIMNIIFVDDEATSIMGVKEYVKSLHNSDVIYNLNGMQVTTPVKGQIYIKGGKKFIQK